MLSGVAITKGFSTLSNPLSISCEKEIHKLSIFPSRARWEGIERMKERRQVNNIKEDDDDVDDNNIIQAEDREGSVRCNADDILYVDLVHNLSP